MKHIEIKFINILERFLRSWSCDFWYSHHSGDIGVGGGGGAAAEKEMRDWQGKRKC